MRVLHVVECWGGGVSTAVAAHVRGTPQYEHWMLGSGRRGEDTGARIADLVRDYRELPSGHLARIRAVGRAITDIRPDVVHAHSSFAGFYVRACPAVPARSVVYTPHCYSFERTDLSRPVRSGLRLAEAIMARRTGIVAAVSPREAALAEQLYSRGRVVYVPNAVPSRPSAQVSTGRHSRPVIAVTVGRICRQKDPEFLAQASAQCEDEVRWIWIGDGDPAARTRLQESGVEITGWLPNVEVLRLLDTADVYVHSAAWESAPMALLEAAASGLPVIGRRIKALEDLKVPDLVETPSELAAAVHALSDPAKRMTAVRRLRLALCENSPQLQTARLTEAYELVTRPEDTVRQR